MFRDQRQDGEPHAAVYISAALNARRLPGDCAAPTGVALDMSVDEAMKMIITCGVVSPCSHADALKARLAKPAAPEARPS